MVSPATLAVGAVVAALIGFTIYFRRELGETGVFVGSGLGALGRGLQQFGAGAGGGIGQFVTGAFSPKIRPEFVPTVGFKLELPFGIGGSGATEDDRLGGRSDGIGFSPSPMIGRIGEPPIPSDVRSGAREPRVFQEGAWRIL